MCKIIISFLNGFIFLLGISYGQNKIDTLNDAEKFVLNQVKKGYPAKLQEVFHDSNKRVLRGEFITNLLLNKEQNYVGVIIQDAFVKGTINLSFSEIPLTINIINTNFEGRFLLEGSEVKYINLSGSFFLDEFNLKNLKVEGQLLLNNVVLKKGIDASYTSVNGEFQFSKALVEGFSDFSGLRVNQTASFSKSTFLAGVYMRRMRINENLIFDGCTFLDKIDARYSFIGGNLQFSDVNTDSIVEFSVISVARNAIISGSYIKNEFSMFKSVIANSLFFENVNSSSSIVLSGIHVGEDARFHDSYFKGNLFMEDASIEKWFHFTNVILDSSGFFTNTNAMYGNIIECHFKGPLDLSYSVIKRNLSISVISDSTSNLASLRIGEHIFLCGSHFKGNVNLSYSTILGNLRLDSVKFYNNVNFDHLKVEDKIVFDSTSFNKDVSFRNATLNRISWNHPNWNYQALIQIDGMTFQTIEGYANRQLLCDSVLVFLSKIPFTQTLYVNLESQFAKGGYQELANNVYFEMKDRERRESGFGKSITSLFSKWIMGFGRNPEWAIYYIGIFIVIGSILFRSKWMEQKDENTKISYTPLYFSFDLFFPFVELPMIEQWQPKPDKRFLWFYFRIHKIAGWILISIFVLSYTGIIK